MRVVGVLSRGVPGAHFSADFVARGLAKRFAIVARRRGRRRRVRGGGERGVETRRRTTVRHRAVLARREASLEIARETV